VELVAHALPRMPEDLVTDAGVQHQARRSVDASVGKSSLVRPEVADDALSPWPGDDPGKPRRRTSPEAAVLLEVHKCCRAGRRLRSLPTRGERRRRQDEHEDASDEGRPETHRHRALVADGPSGRACGSSRRRAPAAAAPRRTPRSAPRTPTRSAPSTRGSGDAAAHRTGGRPRAAPPRARGSNAGHGRTRGRTPPSHRASCGVPPGSSSASAWPLSGHCRGATRGLVAQSHKAGSRLVTATSLAGAGPQVQPLEFARP